MSLSLSSDPELLLQALAMQMPFGKYSGSYLIDLPEPYLVWFNRQGFPEGKLGGALALAYEVKLNVLEAEIRPMVMHYINTRK